MGDEERVRCTFSQQLTAWRAIFDGVLIEEAARIYMKLAGTGVPICPGPELVFNAFASCGRPLCVIVGQDPYPDPRAAMGLAFSVAPGIGLPPSLRSIFECLEARGLLFNWPSNGFVELVAACRGDLTAWAKQGVLLLNSALTTEVGKSGAHVKNWAAFTDVVIGRLARAFPRAIFIAFGNAAISKLKGVADMGTVLEWGHPSPLNSENRRGPDGKFLPGAFINCSVFWQTNKAMTLLGHREIIWDPALFVLTADPAHLAEVLGLARPAPMLVARRDDPPLPAPCDGNVYMFTDGASRANGKKNCRASWAFYITNGQQCGFGQGEVAPGPVNPSNNRGELLAIIHGSITYAASYAALNSAKSARCICITDSMYCIGSATEWEPSAEKKNMDLIVLLRALVAKYKIEFLHVKGHCGEPENDDSAEWFFWFGNSRADGMCTAVLSTDP